MAVAAQGARHVAKQSAKKAAQKAAKRAAKKQIKKKIKKKVKDAAKKKIKKKVKDKAKKKAKKKIKKKVKDKVKKKAKKKLKKKAKKKAKNKVKKKMKNKAKKKIKDKAKKKMKKKVKEKVKEKVQEKVEEKVEEYIDDARQRLLEPSDSEYEASISEYEYDEEAMDADIDAKLNAGKSTWRKCLETCCKLLCCCCICCCCRKRRKQKKQDEEADKVRKELRQKELKRQEPCCNCAVCRTGSYANEVVKNIYGFLTGSFLMFVFYCVFRFVMKQDISQSMSQTAVLGIFLTFGMAFSRNTRCLVFLMLPSLFSSKGRTMLMAYAFILVLSGPAENLTYNMDMATKSQTCGSALAMNQTRQMFELATAPVASILDSVKLLISKLKDIIEKVHKAFQAIADAVKAIGNAIQKLFDWLGNMVSRCNTKMAAPQITCEREIASAKGRCIKSMGILSGITCDIVNVVNPICKVAGMGQLLCLLPASVHFVASKAIGGFQDAIDELERQFYVDFDITHNFTFTHNVSKTPNEIKDAILKELDERTHTFRLVLEWCSQLLSLSFLYLFVKAWRYRSKYLSKDKFDNFYVTDYLEKIDRKRERRGWENILPLSEKEQKKFIKPCTYRMARGEKIKMIIGLILWITQVYNAALVLFADFGAFWFLDMVRRHTELKVNYGAPGSVSLSVEGEGLLADVYKVLVNTLDPSQLHNFTVDTTVCLPHPSPPNFAAYETIITIFALCLFLIIFEAYGLRLRRAVASHYYPDREKQRILFLYNKLLRKRTKLFKTLRARIKQAIQLDGGVLPMEKVSLRSHLAAGSRICRLLLKCCGYHRKFCVACGQPGKTDDLEHFKHCDNAGCAALYCIDCFAETSNTCLLCYKPVDYAAACSDVSLERDSSDEEEYQNKKMAKQSNQNNASTCNTELVVVNIEDTITCNNPQYEGASGGYELEEEELPRPGSATTFDAVNFGYIDDDTTELVPDNTSDKDYTPLYAEVEYGWGAGHPNAADEDSDDYDLNLWDDDESWVGDEFYTYGVDDDDDDEEDDDDDDDLELDYNYDSDDDDSDDNYDVRYSHEANWRQGQYRTFGVVAEGGGGNSKDPEEGTSCSDTYKQL